MKVEDADEMSPSLIHPFKQKLGPSDWNSSGPSHNILSIAAINAITNSLVPPLSFLQKYVQFHCTHLEGKRANHEHAINERTKAVIFD